MTTKMEETKKNSEEFLYIENFLVIKNAFIEINDLNIIIGPQANGKSLIAKLTFFFCDISTQLIKSIRAGDTKTQFDKKILSEFENRFPRYSWEGKTFSITYSIDGLIFQVIGNKNKSKKTTIKLSYPEQFSKDFKKYKKVFQRQTDAQKEEIRKEKHSSITLVQHQILLEQVINPLKDKYPTFINENIFIPASRSFFANLQKNIFTFLSSNLDIDPFLKDFGKFYENAKYWYKNEFLDPDDASLKSEIHALIESIVDGDYEYHDDQDWLVKKGKKINLVNASSGQQESLPMLLVLSVWPFIYSSNSNMVFIEEPEAHLFPTSQGHILSLISLLLHYTNCRFFITTHSPYIISALNNFLLASELETKGKINKEQFKSINGKGCPINFKDVSTYTISNGEVRDIKDNEFEMVGSDILDNVSEHFEEVMNKMLEC